MIADARSDIRSKITEEENETDELVLLKFTYSNGVVNDREFHPTNDDEFSYKGDMYDIERSEIHDGYIYYYCINDSKEERINKSLVNHINDNLPDSQAPQKKSDVNGKVSISKYLPHRNIKDVFPPIINLNKLYHSTENLLSIKLDIETPPPEII